MYDEMDMPSWRGHVARPFGMSRDGREAQRNSKNSARSQSDTESPKPLESNSATAARALATSCALDRHEKLDELLA